MREGLFVYQLSKERFRNYLQIENFEKTSCDFINTLEDLDVIQRSLSSQLFSSQIISDIWSRCSGLRLLFERIALSLAMHSLRSLFLIVSSNPAKFRPSPLATPP
jgi:hypothetical protein